MANFDPMKTRLKEAFNYLKAKKQLEQKDVASLMNTSETTISRNINAAGAGRVNTDFLIRLNEAVGNPFNIQYIIDGSGALLAKEKAANPSFDENAAHDNLIEILARTIRGVDDLRIQLQQELAEVRALKDELRQLAHHPVVYMSDEQQCATAAEPTEK